MNVPVCQFETEEAVIRDNLLKAGYETELIEQTLSKVRSHEPEDKIERNIAIRQIYRALRGRPCALQAWYIHELISRITGLVPETVRLICHTVKPENIIVKRRKNQNQ